MKRLTCKINKLLIISLLAGNLIMFPKMAFAAGSDSLTSENIEITLHLKASDNLSGVSKVMVSNYSDFRGAKWEDIKDELEWALDEKASTKIVYVKYMDKAGNVSKVYSKTIPENLLEETLTINEGNPFTKNNVIKIEIKTKEPAIEFSISNDRKNWSQWQKLNNEISYKIPGDDGKKKIYIRFKNEDGKIVTKLVPGIVILDRTTPTIDNIKTSLDEKDTAAVINADFNDELSGVIVKKIASGNRNIDYFKNNGQAITGSNVSIKENGEYTLYVQDKSGNSSVKNIVISNIENKEGSEKNQSQFSRKQENDFSENVSGSTNKELGINAKDDANNGLNKNEDKDLEKNKDLEKESNKLETETDKQDSVDSISSDSKKDNGTDEDSNQGKDSEKVESGIHIFSYWWILIIILLILYFTWKKVNKKNNSEHK